MNLVHICLFNVKHTFKRTPVRVYVCTFLYSYVIRMVFDLVWFLYTQSSEFYILVFVVTYWALNHICVFKYVALFVDSFGNKPHQVS